MPIKEGLRPKKHVVIRDLKREIVKAVFKDRTLYGTLANTIIPDRFMAETNPNNPLELDVVNCWNTEQLRWDTFKISELEEYLPNGSQSGEQERREDGEDSGRVGDNPTEETSQET
jgi:hypothetical protein